MHDGCRTCFIARIRAVQPYGERLALRYADRTLSLRKRDLKEG